MPLSIIDYQVHIARRGHSAAGRLYYDSDECDRPTFDRSASTCLCSRGREHYRD